MCRYTNRLRVAEPEVYFRIVHVTLQDDDVSPAYHEQTVEISLGPKGAFANGNIGTLTRRVPAGQVVTAVPEHLRRSGRPRPPREPCTPRVVELLQKAMEWQAQLDSGEVSSQAEIARNEGLTRARVTQVIALLRLAPEIHDHILSLPDVVGRPPVTERILRPIAKLDDPRSQVDEFQNILSLSRIDG